MDHGRDDGRRNCCFCRAVLLSAGTAGQRLRGALSIDLLLRTMCDVPIDQGILILCCEANKVGRQFLVKPMIPGQADDDQMMSIEERYLLSRV